MDFIFGLPPTKDNDSIWVIVDRLTKTTHFIRMKMRTRMDVLAQKYIEKVIKLQRTPVSIMLTEMRLLDKFWASLQAVMGTTLSFSTTYHPQIDGQIERTKVIHLVKVQWEHHSERKALWELRDQVKKSTQIFYRDRFRPLKDQMFYRREGM